MKPIVRTATIIETGVDDEDPSVGYVKFDTMSRLQPDIVIANIPPDELRAIAPMLWNTVTITITTGECTDIGAST